MPKGTRMRRYLFNPFMQISLFSAMVITLFHRHHHRHRRYRNSILCDVPTDDVVGRGFVRLCLLAESQDDSRPRRVNTYPLSPVTGNTCFLTESQDDFPTESQEGVFYEAFLRPSFWEAFFFGKASLSSLLLTERMKWRLRLFFPGRGLLPVSGLSGTGRTL